MPSFDGIMVNPTVMAAAENACCVTVTCELEVRERLVRERVCRGLELDTGHHMVGLSTLLLLLTSQ